MVPTFSCMFTLRHERTLPCPYQNVCDRAHPPLSDNRCSATLDFIIYIYTTYTVAAQSGRNCA